MKDYKHNLIVPNSTTNKSRFRDNLESSHMTSTSRAKYGEYGKHVWERQKQSRHTLKEILPTLLCLIGKVIERAVL